MTTARTVNGTGWSWIIVRVVVMSTFIFVCAVAVTGCATVPPECADTFWWQKGCAP